MASDPIGRIERAIQDVATAYKGLKRAGGYRFTLKMVSRHFRDPDDWQEGEVPGLIVYRPIGGGEDLRYLDSGAPGGYWSTLLLWLLGYARSGGESAPAEKTATLGEALLSDIRALQMRDPRFGSAVIADSTLVGPAQNDGGFFDAEGAVVVQPVRLSVLFDVAGNNLP